MGEHGPHVVGDRAHPDHHVIGVFGVVGDDGGVAASGQFGVLGHRLADERRDCAGEVSAVVGRASLEVGLVLDGSGQPGVVRIDQGGDELAGAFGEGVDPLPAPLRLPAFGHPSEGVLEDGLIAGLDRVRLFRELAAQRGEVVGVEVGGVPVEVGLQLEEPALGAEEQFLGHGRAGDASGGVAEVIAQEFGLGQQGFAHHVAGGEAVHGVGDRDQRQGGRAVGDRREVGGLLRVGAEQDCVAGGQQRVDVVVPGHHVERVLGDHAGGDLQHEAADLLADRDVVRLEAVEDALAGGRVGDEIAAGQRGAERSALGRVLALGLDEERVLAPDVELAFGAGCLEDLGDLGGRCDRIADHTATDLLHHIGDRAVAVDDFGDAGELRAISGHATLP